MPKLKKPKMITDPKLVEAATIEVELRAEKQKYDRSHKLLRKHFKGHVGDMIIGTPKGRRFRFTGREESRTDYPVPEEVRAAYAIEGKRFCFDVVEITE